MKHARLLLFPFIWSCEPGSTTGQASFTERIDEADPPVQAAIELRFKRPVLRR